MTVAPPSLPSQQVMAASSNRSSLSTGGPVVSRRGSIEDGERTSTGSNTAGPRRSSLSSICKVKISSVVVMGKKSATPIATSTEGFLQSADKRRRYMRRGSKTSFMLRTTSSGKVDFPPEWQAALAAAIKTNATSSSNTSILDDGTMHSQNSSSNGTSFSLLMSSSASSSRSSSSLLPHPQTVPSTPFSCTESPSASSDNSMRPITLSTQRAAQLEVLLRANQEIISNLNAPIFNRGRVEDCSRSSTNNRRQSTVSLLTSALELSCIEDQR